MEQMLYTVPEVAEILKTNVDYVYRLQKAGLLKFLKIGRWKCRQSTLEAFLEKYDGYDITYHLDGGENHADNPFVVHLNFLKSRPRYLQ